MKMVIAGGSGFLGTALARHFSGRSYEVVIISRAPEPDADFRSVWWDGKTLGDWTKELEHADVLINLAGKSVDCRYHRKNRAEILNSRLNATCVLGRALASLRARPKVWINASSATIYRASWKHLQTEESTDIGDDFSMTVCKKWEEAFFAFPFRDVRPLILRTAITLGREGGALVPFKRLAQARLGGPMGPGTQWFSWIHEFDFCRAIEWLIQNPKASGIYNLTSPQPVTNRTFLQQVRRALKISLGIGLPGWCLALGAFVIRTETELVLKSRKVYPKRLLQEGFEFRFSNVGSALDDLFGRGRPQIN